MSDPSPSSSSSSICLHSKLRFFARVRRFLRSKTWKSKPIKNSIEGVTELEAAGKGSETGEETGDGGDCLDLQRSVKKLHFGSWEEKEAAAVNITRLASKDGDVKTRKLIAELGVVPVLVEMVGSGVVSRRRAAVKALIELANGTYTNKALILEAGILSKFPTTTAAAAVADGDQFAELILSLSSLPNTQFHLSLPFLITTLESPATSSASKASCLGALFNLSATLENAAVLASNGVVSTLLTVVSKKPPPPLAEKALATLGNLVVTASGKRAMEDSSAVPEGLIEVLTWEDNAKCQELSAYVLMILAYQSAAQREKMGRCGIVPVLLELALLGSPLAQKRALKLLQWFKDEREMKMGPHSGPQTGRLAIGSPINPREAQEGRRLIKDLVKQSLNKNMEMITRRANAAGGSSKLKNLVISTSSKSLPY